MCYAVNADHSLYKYSELAEASYEFADAMMSFRKMRNNT